MVQNIILQTVYSFWGAYENGWNWVCISDNRYPFCYCLPFWLHFLQTTLFLVLSSIRIKILVNHLRNPHKLLTQPKLKTICHNITLLYSHYGTLIQVSRTILGLTSGREKKGYTFMVVNTIYASPTENDTFNKNTCKKTLWT